MKKVRNTILHFRRQHSELQGLVDACGSSPSRPPPSASLISELRVRVGRKLGLAPATADAHHPASPWRFALVQRIVQLVGDPDTEIGKWLEHGTPVGISVPIRPSGLLPLVSETPSTSADRLREQVQWTHNHPSFGITDGGDCPAHLLLQELVDEGFALVFSDIDAAEAWLGSKPVPSPLGNVVRVKADGSLKHRLIQDLKASSVNGASVVPERQVLPRFLDHARDIALASSSGSEVGVFVVDFKNAFMTLPLHQAELPFNTSSAPHGVQRHREPLYDDEPVSGTFLVWRVLGFGGHSNPLTYSRVACFAARSGQALLMTTASPSSPVAQGRIQLYVDDPVVTLEGPLDAQRAAVDLLCLWWLVLGIPLSWSKGTFGPGRLPHEWIGVRFWSRSRGTATLSVPQQFVNSLLQVAQVFVSSSPRTASLADAHSLCGKAGRLAQVVPAAKPFVTQLFAALAASLRSHHLGLREAPPKRVAKKRFRLAASWIVGLLSGDPFPLEHTISLSSLQVDRHTRRVEFDASPWGGGFVLREGNDIVEWGSIKWDSTSASPLEVAIGLPKWQTLWELITFRS